MRSPGIYAVAEILTSLLSDLDGPSFLRSTDWVVLHWNEDAKAVYQKMGAYHKKEWEGMRLEGEALKRLGES